ncbi:MAG: dihydroflavonol-4-reductase [Bacteroidia bacterium]|jgi:dihydroflavonol-4-reductase
MVFVTGGTGLVGSHIIAELLKNGEHIRALCRAGSDKRWFEKTAHWLLGNEANRSLQRLTWIEGDVLDMVSLVEGMEGCKEVYHCAALVSFSQRDDDDLHQANVIGTQNLINACLGMDARPNVCHISSTASIGGKKDTVINESHEFDKEASNSYYSYTKYLAELEAYRGREEGLNVAIINPSIILGFGNWNKGPSKFFKNGLEEFAFYATGSNAFVDARDVATAALGLMQKKQFSHRYLCTAWNMKYQDLSNYIADCFGKKRPRFKASKIISAIAWRLVSFASLFGVPSLITKASALSGRKNMAYNSDELISAINFSFREADQSITEICGAYKSL